MKELSNSTVLVTACGGVLGQAVATELARRGATIVAHDSDASASARLVETLTTAGHTARSIEVDVVNAAGVAATIRSFVQKHGSIDVLVNIPEACASGSIEELTEELFSQTLATQVRAAFFLCQAVVPDMKAKRFGRVINVTSTLGLVGGANAAVLAATRSALLGLTKAWALEFAGDGILVNAVAPLESDQGEMPVSHESAAYTVAFLASPNSSFVTGQTISPNGGNVFVGN